MKLELDIESPDRPDVAYRLGTVFLSIGGAILSQRNLKETGGIVTESLIGMYDTACRLEDPEWADIILRYVGFSQECLDRAKLKSLELLEKGERNNEEADYLKNCENKYGSAVAVMAWDNSKYPKHIIPKGATSFRLQYALYRSLKAQVERRFNDEEQYTWEETKDEGVILSFEVKSLDTKERVAKIEFVPENKVPAGIRKENIKTGEK
jgi:hypothetical protein